MAKYDINSTDAVSYVKFDGISSENLMALQRELNHWAKERPNANIINVQYQISGLHNVLITYYE